MNTTHFHSLTAAIAVVALCAGICIPSSVSAAEFTLSPPILFGGALDGSAAIDAGGGFFIGATDEENVLRVYDTKDGKSKDLAVDLEAAVKSALGENKIKECDIEGAAKIGDVIYWIGSYGRNKDAKEKKERQVFFGTRVSGKGKGATLAIEGEVYTKLLEDLVNHPDLKALKLEDAAKLPPKEKGALNIESLAADGDRLLIGFRNPTTTKGEALVVPLLNPTETIKKGGRAKLGKPLFLKLDGLGIRDMAVWKGGFLVIAGDYDDRFEPTAKSSQLFSWKKGSDPKSLKVNFGDLNPEAIVVAGDGSDSRVLILSDDGKYPKQPGKAFRGVWLQSAKP